MDTRPVGIEAARLMEDLAEEDLPEDAEIRTVGLVIEVAYADGDPSNPVRQWHTRCSMVNRVRQIGLFAMAQHVTLTAPGDDEEDEEP